MLISPENALMYRLLTAPGVASLVGFSVFPIAVPKSPAFPFVVYKRANITREYSLATPFFEPMVHLQIASWATSHDGARELGDEVRLALNGHTGTILGCKIHDVRLVSETDDFLDPTVVGAQLPPAYEVRQLYQVRWTESAV